MPSAELLRQTLRLYDERLLRQVAARLCKPRNHWPVDELIERCVAVLENPAGLDRRLADLSADARRLLGLMAHSRLPYWPIGNLVELLMTFGASDGLAPVVELLESGLLFPELNRSGTGDERVHSLEHWPAHSGTPRPVVFTLPLVLNRVLGHELELPVCPGAVPRRPEKPESEADGLDWLLRLAVLWQLAAAGSLRRTQKGDFFKRDLDRLHADAVLHAPPQDGLTELPDPALLTVEVALRQGLVRETDGELQAGDFPASWQTDLSAALASLWTSVLQLRQWSVQNGWQPDANAGNPFPSLYVAALLLLCRLPSDGWARTDELQAWLLDRHPFWRDKPLARKKEWRGFLARFFGGIAYPLRLVQAARDRRDELLVRLSALGTWLLGFGPQPKLSTFPHTLLIQPNLEILVYRQGLTPALIARLSRFAAWKSCGAACTLQLEPASVYRALQAGESFDTILETLQSHNSKPVPETVKSALRTWANKRERMQVYPAAALFEFLSAEDLAAALGRGLPAVRLSDRLAVVANESAVDYRHFRLTATRDYGLPLEKCVQVEADGVTLSIDLARSDLLIETEVGRFAEPLEPSGPAGMNPAARLARRLYRMTPASLEAATQDGLTVQALEPWFVQRTGQLMPPAVRLLLTGAHLSPWELQRLIVLRVPSVETADGLQQWPQTRTLIHARLGPAALVVTEENRAALEQVLASLGIDVRFEEGITLPGGRVDGGSPHSSR